MKITKNTKPMSLRIDKWNDIQLDNFCKVTRRKKNRVINDAIKMLMDDYNNRPLSYLPG